MKILNRSLRRLSRACTTRQGALKKLAGFSTAVLAAGMLTGCLIGTSNNAPTTPVPASASPATSVPASTYTGQDLAIFNAINLYRTKVDIAGGAGVGEVAQNTLLDAAAAAHEKYLTNQPGGDIETHDELSTGNFFFGTTPQVRAVNAGFTPTTAWIGEVIGNGAATIDPVSRLPACVSQLLDTVYHLEALTSNVEQIGLVDDPNWACVLEGATITGTSGMTLPSSGNDEPIGGGQQMPVGSVAVSPYNGEVGVLPAMSTNENPAPSLPTPVGALAGHPVMLRMRADLASDVLLVNSFTLTDSSGSSLPGTILLSSNAVAGSISTAQPDALIAPCVAFFVPLTQLASQVTYTAQFVGSRNGIAVNETWSFTTQ